MTNVYTLNGKRLPVGEPFEENGIAYPGNFLNVATAEDLSAHGIVKTEETDPSPVVTPLHVDHEKNKRLALFNFNGIEFDFVDGKGSDSNIQGAYSLAFSAIIAGAQPGNLRWADPALDFCWIAHDNSIVTMDAPAVIEFGKKAAAYKSALIFRARALKNMSPIPADYTSDQYWT